MWEFILLGSCINTAAATVLGGAYCGPEFTKRYWS